jgi:hypothetical protein
MVDPIPDYAYVLIHDEVHRVLRHRYVVGSTKGGMTDLWFCETCFEVVNTVGHAVNFHDAEIHGQRFTQ